MIDSGLALQGAIVAALKADADVSGLAADRVYDAVPDGATYPLIKIGEIQVIDDGAEGIASVEVFVTLHAWSQAVGAVECRRLTGILRQCLHQAALELGDDWQLIDMLHRQSRVFVDADGVTHHGVVTFRALIDPV